AGRVLSGQDVGTTSLKILSPLSDSILAEKTVRVVDDRVTITELGLHVHLAMKKSMRTEQAQLSLDPNDASSVQALGILYINAGDLNLMN
ncbi:putative transmembrane protein 132C, partial [Triplophysa rosa]